MADYHTGPACSKFRSGRGTHQNLGHTNGQSAGIRRATVVSDTVGTPRPLRYAVVVIDPLNRATPPVYTR
jgi:hypothetical protein